MKNCLLSLLAGMVSLTSFTVLAEAPIVPMSELHANAQHLQATAISTRFISEYHYKKTALDDELSGKIFDGYLKNLDPGRYFFLEDDIEKLKKHRLSFDDYLEDVQLDQVFDMYKLFRSKLEYRMKYAMSLLERDFDFSIDENYQFDRSESPWAKNNKELDELWRKRVKNDVLTLKLAGKDMQDIKDVLKKRYERRMRGVEQLNANDVFQIFMNAYTAAIEPHTSYFSPRSSENFKIHLSLSLEGIGAALKVKDEFTVVQRIITGGPADKSKKLHPGDRITGVAQGKDGPMVDVVAWRLEDVVDLIRGPKDSIVRLEILPKDSNLADARKELLIVRNKIKLEEQAAKKSIIDVPMEDGEISHIGVIELPTFYLDSAAMARGEKDYRSTTRDVKKLINELKETGIDGLVIDLRKNGGGALSEAIQLTGLFINEGPVVQVKDSTGRTKVEEDTDEGTIYNGPLVVIVNRYSASASEIFSGAIQDYGRGIIVGEPTFGKGTVQSLVDLDRYVRKSAGGLGQLKTTIAQFFRVSGSSTQNRGVVPDIKFPIAVNPEEQGESALDNALPWASVDKAKYSELGRRVSVLPYLRILYDKREKDDPGFSYLVGVEKMAIENLAKKTTSLLEKKRIKEFDEIKQKKLDKLNNLRLAKGLEPLDIKEISDSEDEEDEVSENEDEKKDKDDVPGDIWLKESARIAADIFSINTGGPRTAMTGK